MSTEIINSTFDEPPPTWLGRGPGRPSKLTPERESQILSEVEKGTPVDLVAQKCGINQDTFYDWMNRGEEDRLNNKVTMFSEFTEKVLIARDRFEASLAEKWIDLSTKPQRKTRRVYKEKVVEKEDGTFETVKFLDSEIIEEVGDGDWQGIAEYMSRRYRRWKRRENVEHTGKDGGPIELQHTVSIDQFPTWLKQAIVVIGSGGQVDAEIEKTLQLYFETRFLECEKLIGSGQTGNGQDNERGNVQVVQTGNEQPENVIDTTGQIIESACLSRAVERGEEAGDGEQLGSETVTLTPRSNESERKDYRLKGTLDLDDI